MCGWVDTLGVPSRNQFLSGARSREKQSLPYLPVVLSRGKQALPYLPIVKRSKLILLRRSVDIWRFCWRTGVSWAKDSSRIVSLWKRDKQPSADTTPGLAILTDTSCFEQKKNWNQFNMEDIGGPSFSLHTAKVRNITYSVVKHFPFARHGRKTKEKDWCEASPKRIGQLTGDFS